MLGKQVKHQWREQWREQGGNCGAGDGQAHIAFGQKGNHIGSGAAWAATHQQNPNGHVQGQAKHHGQNIGDGGHDEKLRQYTNDHAFGVFYQGLEIGKRHCHAHAKHDDAQKPSDVLGKPSKSLWVNEGDGADQQQPQGKGFLDELT